MIFTGKSVDALNQIRDDSHHNRERSRTIIASSWLFSLRRNGKKNKKTYYKLAKSTLDITTSFSVSVFSFSLNKKIL